jgi:hypothetical protein
MQTMAMAALIVAAALGGGCISTATYGTGEAPELAIFREVMGGLGGEKKEPIEYQPRAPLVLPPSPDALPPPAEAAAVANADWPVDPDAAAQANSSDDPERAVSPDDAKRLAPLAGIMPVTRDPDPNDKRNPTYDVIDNPDQVTAFRSAVDAKNTPSDAGRQYLTQPPDTYREPAATAPTEFDYIEKKKKGGIFCLTCWF